MELEARKAKLAETALLLEQGVIPASEHRAAEQRYEAQRLRYAAARRDLEAAQAKADADAVRIARLRLENAETRMRGLEKTLDGRGRPRAGFRGRSSTGRQGPTEVRRRRATGARWRRGGW